MRKDQKWLGLITHASPYSLPRGASQEQVNAQCGTPGQIQARRGMRLASHAQGAMPETRDVFSLRGTQGSRLLSLTADGRLVVLSQITYSQFVEQPAAPSLDPQADQTQVNYLWQYRDGHGPVSDLVFAFYAGSAASSGAEYKLDVSQGCGTGLTSIDAGQARVDGYSGIGRSALCKNANN